MTWRVEIRAQKTELAIVNVIVCQDAWSRLTRKSRAALLVYAGHAGDSVHPASAVALFKHGLITDKGRLTPAGEAVVRHRPDQAAGEGR